MEEFWDILVEDLQNDPDLLLDKPIDEEHFQDKFPFNIKEAEPEKVAEEEKA